MTDEDFKKALPFLEQAGYKQVAQEKAFVFSAECRFETVLE